MKFFGIIATLALTLQAGAFSIGSTPQGMGYNNVGSRYSQGMLSPNTGYTGEDVGAGFLSCGCAEQILAKRVIPGSPCDNFSRIMPTSIASPGSVTGTTAPASPQVTHQN